MTLQLAPIDLELLQRPSPIPTVTIQEVEHQQILQLLDFREAVAVGGSDSLVQVDACPDFFVPALHQPAAETGIGLLELQH